MLAVNVTNGKLVWATPFIVYGTSLKDVTIPDTHDWDLSWGASVSKVTSDNGTIRKLVIGGDKMGHVMAMDALSGHPIWSVTLGTLYRTNVPPKPEGSGPVWPGAGQGAESYHAVDNNNTLYVAVSSMGYNYFVKGSEGYIVPEFNAIKNGIGNGTVTAIDIRTGKVKWEFPTPAPTYISPLVSNGLVFDGYMTGIGKPYPFNAFGNPKETILKPSSIFIALDKDTGKLLWQFNVGGPLGVGGASIGDSMIFVTTGSPSIRPSFTSGSIIAFGLGEER
jgi:outer membrane protein assembly factor BamB